MRLSSQAREAIIDAAKELFGVNCKIFLFGSRVDDSQAGGDIDLLINLQQPDLNKTKKSLQLVAKLQVSLGDQPIDVIVIDPNTKQQAIHKQALLTGIEL